MCLTPIKVKSVHYGEKVSQYIPCGTCDECRRREKSGWSFRLALELQKKLDQGWEIGFCTLTYNDEHLPQITNKSAHLVFIETRYFAVLVTVYKALERNMR